MTFEEYWDKYVKWCVKHCETIESGRKQFAKATWESARPKWQPIETAPVNEMVLILWGDEYICSAILEQEYGEKVWYMYGDIVFDCDPTHWMSLKLLL